MSRKKRRKSKRRGHYCWSCGGYRANEKFSGRGHARHLCKDCTRLSPAELSYRQALRDLERCMWFENLSRANKRKLQRLLHHEHPAIRQVAGWLLDGETDWEMLDDVSLFNQLTGDDAIRLQESEAPYWDEDEALYWDDPAPSQHEPRELWF